ncbi:MAG: DUF192 domain-containing protein [Phycisphaerales bacterium]
MAFTKLILLTVIGLGCLSCTFAAGCDEKDTGKKTEDVKIGAESFTLELALDDETRFKGLSGRTEIAANGGLLFVFPDRFVRVHSFVMRDCPVDIDILYLDKAGRVVASYEMKAESARSEEEKALSGPPGTPEWAKTNDKYENRLKRYSSKFPSQFVIELKGGTIARLGIKNGDKINLDTQALKKRAK